MSIARTAYCSAEHVVGPLRLFVRASGFNEARGNGTPLPDQRNPHLALRNRRPTGKVRATVSLLPEALRLDRALSPDLFEHLQPAHSGDPRLLLSLRRELTKFSLTSRQRVRRGGPLDPAARRWISSSWLEPTFTTCASGTASRAYGSCASLTNLHDHQRDSAAYAELMWVRRAWTLIASSRMDWFQNYDGQQLHAGTAPVGRHPPLSRPIRPARLRSPPGTHRASSRITGPSPPPASAPSARPRPASSTAPPRWATSSPTPTATCSASAPPAGRPALPQSGIGDHSLQLLPHPGQPPHLRRHHQSQLVAHPAACARILARSRAAALPLTSSLRLDAGWPRRRLPVRPCHRDARQP